MSATPFPASAAGRFLGTAFIRVRSTLSKTTMFGRSVPMSADSIARSQRHTLRLNCSVRSGIGAVAKESRKTATAKPSSFTLRSPS